MIISIYVFPFYVFLGLMWSHYPLNGNAIVGSLSVKNILIEGDGRVPGKSYNLYPMR